MTPDNNLVIGIVLIGIALILAFLAYYILTSSREEEIDDEKEVAAEPEVATAEQETAEDELEEPLSSQGDEEVSIDEALELPTPQSEAQPEPPPVVETERQETNKDEPELEATEEETELETTQLELPKTDRVMVPVTTLMRDEITGGLIVQVDDREYTTADELKASDDWNRVEFAASDLYRWLTRAALDERIPEIESIQIRQQPPSMIEQINEILKRRLAESPEENKAVRLIEGPGGTVRVLVGVHSYAIDEVPDSDVQKVIREAVAAWEEDQ
jgi:type IV secretory pathway VirB10-like protein